MIPPYPAAGAGYVHLLALRGEGYASPWRDKCPPHANMWPMAYDASFADDEQGVLLLRPHWKTLVPPMLVAVILVIAALVAEVVIPSGKYLSLIHI